MVPTFHPRNSHPVPSLRHALAPPHASTDLVPRPLKIFKRTARRPEIFALPPAEHSRIISRGSTEEASNVGDRLRPSSVYSASAPSIPKITTLAKSTESANESSIESPESDRKLKPQPLNIASIIQLGPPFRHPDSTISAINHDQLPPHSPNPLYSIHCSLCSSPLSPLQIYTFPATAPSITARVLILYPGLALSPAFCATCFESIHKMHICWGCGFRVHRREERVGCGWAWWHWGCLGCLLCRVCFS